MVTTSYGIKGMSCAHCVTAVTGELSGLRGVSSVTVDLVPDGVSHVTVVSENPLDETAVGEALDEAGGYLIAGG